MASLHELEQEMDLSEHRRDQDGCYRCDRIAFTAMVVWLCVFGCGITAALAWFMQTD